MENEVLWPYDILCESINELSDSGKGTSNLAVTVGRSRMSFWLPTSALKLLKCGMMRENESAPEVGEASRAKLGT